MEEKTIDKIRELVIISQEISEERSKPESCFADYLDCELFMAAAFGIPEIFKKR